MNMRRFLSSKILQRILRITAFTLLAGIAAHLVFSEKNIYREDIGFSCMSTTIRSRFYVRDKQVFPYAANLVRREFLRVDALCNPFRADSELARLNQSAFREPFHCSEELWQILSEARRFHRLSEGAFDITIEPLMKLWGFRSKEKRLPSKEEIADVKKRVGLEKVIFDDSARTVRFTVDGMSLNLGGIAKGWALDRAAAAAKKTLLVNGKPSAEASLFERFDAWFRGHSVRLNSGYIDAGGNVLVLPEPPPREKAYLAGVRNPLDRRGKPCAAVRLLNEAVSTSGNYERYVMIDGKHYTHIIDPATGLPVENMLSVSVVTPRGVDSDALSTAIFLRGKEFALRMKKVFPSLRVLIFFRDPENPGKTGCFQIGSWENVEVPELPAEKALSFAPAPAPAPAEAGAGLSGKN